MSVRSEARWWGRLLRGLARHAGVCCVLVAVAWFTVPTGVVVLSVVVGLTVALRAWAVWSPATFGRWSAPVAVRLKRRQIKQRWPELCRRSGLSVDGDVPRTGASRLAWPHVQLVVAPTLGQTVEHFEAAAESLRTGVSASRLRVEPCGARDVLLTFTVGDELRAPFDAAVPHAVDDLDAVVVGRREDAQPWRLVLGPHTLVAGCSGSGKGSVFWSFAFGLALSVRAGRVQLHGIDLKGGMEVLMGRSLFSTVATDAAEAVGVLERLVGLMQERSATYAGRVRSHVATTDEPMHVVMIDELAALTAYCPERELQRRAETAINLLCSQGRAPGFMVFACLQDPRKEVIPSRGLFTQMVGLRLKDLSETAMVLGELAVTSGAHCHRITRDVPGTGYVLPEDGSHPVRVRAGFASDEAIQEVAQEYATPYRTAVEPATVQTRSRRSERRTTSSGDAA